MSVHVLKNFPPLASLPLAGKDLMREIGLLARERVYQRTVAGTDMHGHPFAPLSPGYKEQKMREIGTGRANLQASGDMLNSLRIVNVTEDSVEIGFK